MDVLSEKKKDEPLIKFQRF